VTGDRPRPTVAAGLTVLGGAAMVVGALLSFAEIGAGELSVPAQSVGVLDTPDGRWFLGVGIGLLVLGAFLWLATSAVPRQVAAVLIIAGAAFRLYAAIVLITGIEDEGLDAIAEAGAARASGISVAQVRAALDQLNVTIDPGIGLYMVIAGAALGLIGGILALLSRTPTRTEAVPAPPPPPELPEPPKDSPPS
jgi:hypothetical protein